MLEFLHVIMVRHKNACTYASHGYTLSLSVDRNVNESFFVPLRLVLSGCPVGAQWERSGSEVMTLRSTDHTFYFRV